MSEFKNEQNIREPFHKHFNQLRDFQFSYYEKVSAGLEKSDTYITTALYSFCTLGIISVLQNDLSICIALVLALIILINLISTTILNSKKWQVAQRFLEIAADLNKPLYNHHLFKDFEKEYSSRIKKLDKDIRYANSKMPILRT